MSAPTPCEWTLDQRIAYARGLLDDVGRARFESHLAVCVACRNSLDTLRQASESTEVDPMHLPPSLVAEWESAAARLRGVERRAVREHVAECEECRNLLEVLGLDATLAVVPELEATDPEWLAPANVPGEFAQTAPDGAGPRATPTVSRPVDRYRLPRLAVGRALGFGGWAVAAALIATTFWRSGNGERVPRSIPSAGSEIRVTEPAPVPMPPSAPSPPPTPAVEAPGRAGHTAAHAELLALRRGDESPEADGDAMPPRPAHIGRATGWITVPIPEELWGMARDQVVEIQIRDPRHRLVFSVTLRVGDLDPQQELVWPIDGLRLESGTYELQGRTRTGRGGSARNVPTRRFELVVDAR